MHLPAFRNVKMTIGVLGAAYVIGAVLYSAHLGCKWYVEGVIPDRPLWIYLLTPFAVVAIWLGMEKLGAFVGNGFTSDETKQSKWRRVAGFIGMFFLLTGLLIGLPMYYIGKGS